MRGNLEAASLRPRVMGIFRFLSFLGLRRMLYGRGHFPFIDVNQPRTVVSKSI
jgi:hypothetical protein